MWLNDVKHVDSYEACECKDGTYEISVLNCEAIQTQKDGTNILNVYLMINDASAEWNKVPYKYSIWEGKNFDVNFSKLCDCFGVSVESASQNLSVFSMQRGMATFCHSKKQSILEGVNADGTPKIRWETVPSEEVRLSKFIKKTIEIKENNAIENFKNDIPIY